VQVCFFINMVVFHVADLDVGGLIVIGAVVVVVAFKIPDDLTLCRFGFC
jgi:hypothetical protein